MVDIFLDIGVIMVGAATCVLSAGVLIEVVKTYWGTTANKFKLNVTGGKMTDIKQIISSLEELEAKRPFLNMADAVNNLDHRNLIMWALSLSELLFKIKRDLKLKDLEQQDPLLVSIYESLEAAKNNYIKFYSKEAQKHSIRDIHQITEKDIQAFLAIMSQKVDLLFKGDKT